MKNSLLVTLVCLFSIVNNYSQNGWTLNEEKKGVSIFTKEVFCDLDQGFNRDLILLRIVNSNNNDIQISFKINKWVNKNCVNCNSNSNEFYKTFTVKSNHFIEGNCTNSKESNLSFFVKFNDNKYKNSNPKILTKYSLENLKVLDK